MARGFGCDWPRAIATAPTAARNRLRSTAMLIRLPPDDLGELIARPRLPMNGDVLGDVKL